MLTNVYQNFYLCFSYVLLIHIPTIFEFYEENMQNT